MADPSLVMSRALLPTSELKVRESEDSYRWVERREIGLLVAATVGSQPEPGAVTDACAKIADDLDLRAEVVKKCYARYERDRRVIEGDPALAAKVLAQLEAERAMPELSRQLVAATGQPITPRRPGGSLAGLLFLHGLSLRG